MPKFVYVAKDLEGRSTQGFREAESRQEVVSLLRREGLIPISVGEITHRIKFAQRKTKEKRGRVKLEDVALFCRQLSAMLEGGLPVIDCVRDIADQAENIQFRKVLYEVAREIETGSSFSGALSKYPKVFPPLLISMSHAGEESGTLGRVLGEVASFMEDQIALRRKIKSATRYPLFIFVFFIIAISIVVFFLVPRFQKILSEFGTELPLLTRMVMNTSHFLIKNLPFIGGGLLGIFILTWLYSRSSSGKAGLDALKLKLPLIGKLIHKIALARFAHTLSILLAGGVSIITSLEIVGRTCGNRVIEEAINRTREGIIRGSTLAQELAKDGLFPNMVVRMVAAGEETGRISEMLERVSNFYRDEVDTSIEGLLSLIEPILIVGLGVVVGIAVMAVYLPIFKIATSVKY